MVSLENSKNSFQIDLELRKRHEKTVLKITEEDLINNQDKILSTIKKECVDFSSWFYIILYYYSKGDYASFHKFSEELSKADVEQNPFYKDQKIFYIHILSILSFFYSFISQKSKDKTNYSNYSSSSTSLSNHSEKVIFAPINLICKGFLYFTQGDYDSSDTYFSNISTYTSLPKNIVILAKLGRALNAYNQNNFNKSIEFLTSLINDYNYINENVLESIGICYYNGKNLEKAKEIFEKIVEYYPNNYKVKTYLAVLKLGNIENQNEKEFNDNFNQLINAYKLNNYSDVSIPILLINLCNLLLLSGKYDEAGILCKKLNDQLDYGEIKFNENNDNNSKKKKNYRRDYNEIRSAIYTINAKYSIMINKRDEAFQYFLRAEQENSKNIEAEFGLGQIYLESQNFSDAEKCFVVCKKIMDENKKVSFKVLKYLAYILSITKRKEIEKTIDLYKQAIAVKNDDIDCYIKLAELLSLKSPEESIKYYQEAIKFIKENETNKDYFQENIFSNQILPEILNNMACILLRLGKVENVEEYLKESKKLIKEELKKINEDEKEKKSVPKEKKIRLNALNIGVDFNYALYYESRAMFDYAHFLYKKIIKENPYFIEAYIKLCDLYKMRGNKTKAEFYIKQAIDKHFTEKKEKEENETKEGKDNNEKENNKKKMRRLISIMNKPVNPMLIEALIYYESGKETEAIIVLNQILQQYSPNDPYTLIFLGNIYYNLAIEIRNKNHFTEKLNHAIELYFRALEYDKYNAMAAIGLCNCLCEYNYTDKALEIYKTVIETMENNTNAFINESFIYMNDKKYAKASIILHKVLKKLYNGKNPVIENLLGKCYIETKEFSKANKILKNLMMRFPDVITYKFNYGTLLTAKSQEKLSKNDRKVKDTEEVIQLINRAEKIFEMINNIRRDEKEERILKNREFYYKCSEMITVCSSILSRANDNLKEDQKKESEMNLKIKNNIEEYKKKLEYQKQNEEINKNRNVLSEENYNRNKELEAKLTNMGIEDSPKEKKGKKKEKKNNKNKNKNEKDEVNEEKNNKEKKKKKRKLHKRKNDENDEEELQNENEELQNENRELQNENKELGNENEEMEKSEIDDNDNENENNNKMVVDDEEKEDNKMDIDNENNNQIENKNESQKDNKNEKNNNEEIDDNENANNNNEDINNDENENNKNEDINNDENENNNNEEIDINKKENNNKEEIDINNNENNNNEDININENENNEKEEIKNEDVNMKKESEKN